MAKRGLDERKKKILRALVRTYIQTGEPVGSERLYSLYRFGVSAATIRNILAELEDLGYLAHPHTSAGRVPTDAGYRFYVDTLPNRRPLPAREIEQIQLCLSAEDSTDKLMMRTSRLLSSITRNLAIVVTPPMTYLTLKHVEFIKLTSTKILAVLISQSGQVQHKVIKAAETFSQEELNQAARYLVATFQGKSLEAIRQELRRLMSQERAQYDRLMKGAILFCHVSLAGDGEEDKSGAVYLDGASHLMEKPEFADARRMQDLLKAIEEKNRLMALLSACIHSQTPGLTVRIGRENALEGMQDCALIAAPLGYGDVIVGSVGVLGSTRMEYEKAIRIVDCVAKVFGDVLQGFNA